MVNTLWNKIAKIYDITVGTGHNFYKKMILEIKKELKPNYTVLEVAVGTGTIATNIASSVSLVYGCDISPNMIKVAKEKAKKKNIKNIHLSVQNGCNMAWANNKFDVVIIAAALHLIPEPDRILKEVKRVLKPDGILIAPTFVSGCTLVSHISTVLMRISGYYDYQAWTGTSFIDYLEEHGFHVRKAKGYRGIIPMQYVVAKVK